MGFDMKVGTWSVEWDKLCLEMNIELISQYNSGKQCMRYSFSDGGDTLTLKDPTGLTNILVLTKK
jgi:hypothetical protein